MTQARNPLLVGFIADLMFATRVSSTAQHLGYDVRWIGDAGDLPGTAGPSMEGPGELLEGQSGALFERLTAWQPALLIFDLDNAAIPWREWIAALKSSPATRRLPILAFGSHVNTEALAAAHKAGADAVVARSRFSSALPELIQEHARQQETAKLEEDCLQPPPALVSEGISLFNEGHYYKCHDALEEAWRAEDGPVRDLYRAVLQIGIAYFQIERGNYRGALKMLLRVRQWLAPLPPLCQGVDIAQLREDVGLVHATLSELGPAGIADFDRSLFRPVRFSSPD
jgi:predicted metal-dependent hydrolase/CheY-like chemotaxis protein